MATMDVPIDIAQFNVVLFLQEPKVLFIRSCCSQCSTSLCSKQSEEKRANNTSCSIPINIQVAMPLCLILFTSSSSKQPPRNNSMKSIVIDNYYGLGADEETKTTPEWPTGIYRKDSCSRLRAVTWADRLTQQ